MDQPPPPLRNKVNRKPYPALCLVKTMTMLVILTVQYSVWYRKADDTERMARVTVSV